MTERVTTHATFTLERSYPVAAAKAFAAWSEPATKARWFAGPDADHSLDFRVGGQEVAKGVHDGNQLTFTSTYLDIVPGERIVYTSTMYVGDQIATATLTTVEFASTGDATRLVLTEQGAYLDGLEKPEWREDGSGQQLDALGGLLGQ